MSMNRYMARGMSNGGSIFSTDNLTPLADDALRAAVPSLFAVDAHESRSSRFVPIPTINVVEGLRNEGFQPFFAQQARTRIPGKAEYTKHVVRMRHESLKNDAGTAFEIILVNANDGTSAYNMLPGFFRFVCMNGLFVGDSFEGVKVRHSGNAVADVIEGAYTVLSNAPRIVESVDRFKGINLSRQEAIAFADAAHMIRFESAYQADESGAVTLDQTAVPIAPVDLLRPRRTADNQADLWTVFNTVQENAIKGGQRGWIEGANGARRAKVRAVNGIDQSTTLNRALWALADRMADLKAA